MYYNKNRDTNGRLKHRKERNYIFEEAIKAIYPKRIKFIRKTTQICIIKLCAG